MFSTKLKPLFKIAGLVTLGLGIGITGMALYKQSHPGIRRSIASVESYKPSRLMLGKQAAAMSVEIVGPESSASDSNEIVELVGFITQNLEGNTWMDYKWTLPPGVELVQGQINGSIESLNLGQPTQVTLLVRGFTKDRQKLIALSTQLEKAGTELTASAVIVSRPEDTQEARMMDLAARAKAAKEDEEK